MVTKTLDEIVIEEDVKECIRPLFTQATTSGEISFERDWQWQAYCDVLYSLTNFLSDFNVEEPPLFGRKSYNPSQAKDNFEEYLQFSLISIAKETEKLQVYTPDISSVFRTIFAFTDGATIDIVKNQCSLSPESSYFARRIKTLVALSNSFGQARPLFLQKLFEFPGRVNSDITEGIEVLVENDRDIFTCLPNLTEEEYEDLYGIFANNSPLCGSVKPEGKKVVSILQHPREYETESKTSRVLEAMECAEIEIDNYTIIRKIGEGSGRIAYKAWDEKDECYVAVKVAKKNGGTDQSSNRRDQIEEYGEEGLAKKEGHAARQLLHKNVVRYFSRGRTRDERPYVIEEYVEGLTLEAFIETAVRENKVWALREPAPLILEQVLQGVAYLHEEGFVHRDIKPGNILIPDIFRYYGQDWITKVGEVRLGDLELTRKIKYGEEVKGTHGARAYTAPEVLAGKAVSYASDVFSLGVVIYETFTQKHPFVFQQTDKDDKEKIATNISKDHNYPGIHTQIASSTEIPEEYKPIIERCLRYDPHERFQNAGEIIEQLQKARTDREKKRRRKKAGIVTGILAGITACALAAWQIPLYLEERRVEADRRAAEETYELAEKLEAEQYSNPLAQKIDAPVSGVTLTLGKEMAGNLGQRNDVLYVDSKQGLISLESSRRKEDIRFLYRVISNLNPEHAKAKERLCIQNAEIVVDNIALRAGRAHGIDTIYEEESLNEELFSKKEGSITDMVFPELKETIALCEQAISLNKYHDPEVLSWLSHLYEIKREYKKAISYQRRYVDAVKVSDEEDAAKRGILRLAELLEEDEQSKKAYEVLEEFAEFKDFKYNTLKARIALSLTLQRKAVYETNTITGKKHKKKLLEIAITESLAAIEDAEKKELEEKGKEEKKEEIINKELAEAYYLYGLARLIQDQRKEVDYPNKYVLDGELRKGFSAKKKYKRKEKYEPKPLDDATTAFLNAIVLDETNSKFYFGLAETYKRQGNQKEERRAYERGVEIEELRRMQEEEIAIYRDIYPLEKSAAIFRPRATTNGELCNPYLSFKWYLEKNNPDLLWECRTASFLENTEGTFVLGDNVWFTDNNAHSGYVYTENTSFSSVCVSTKSGKAIFLEGGICRPLEELDTKLKKGKEIEGANTYVCSSRDRKNEMIVSGYTCMPQYGGEVFVTTESTILIPGG